MIELRHVTKSYKHYTRRYTSLKAYFLNLFSFLTQKSLPPAVISPISDLSLTIQEGEIWGIMGRNGVGKSTLAKMIAGTIQPTTGKIIVSGRVVPFLELGVAFNPELSGLDNLYLNGSMLGLPLHYLNQHKQEIFEYAEIVPFMQTPLKYYSSGMQLRLAFAIAMHSKGDIYIFDEILSVGDASFQKKCFDAFDSLIAQKKTIILIGHDLASIERYAHYILHLSETGPQIRALHPPKEPE